MYEIFISKIFHKKITFSYYLIKIFLIQGAKCENPLKILIESFFIFMYTGSIIWIVVMFLLIVVAKNQQKVAIKSPHGYNRRLSTTMGPNLPQLKVKTKNDKIFSKKRVSLYHLIFFHLWADDCFGLFFGTKEF
jgi:hypothetical protein